MSDTLLIIGGISLFIFPIFLLIFIIQAIRHKPKKIWGFISLFFLISFVVLEEIGIALACDHNYILISEIQSTCEEKGKKLYYCDKCAKEKTQIIPALEHELIEISRQEATISSRGEIIYSCSRCNKLETETIKKLKCSHEWKDSDDIKICVVCGKTEAIKTSKATDSSTSNVEYETTTEITTSSDTESTQTSLIQVRFELDYIDVDRLHLTVFTKNNSEQIFNGNVHVVFYSMDGKTRLGSDTIFVDDALPGQESWAKVTIDAYYGTPRMEVSFSEVSFSQVDAITSSIDSSATEKTKNNYYWGFFETSWYADITDIIVYTDGSCIVHVKSTTKENGQFYAATIWGCGKDYGVKTVRVIDPNGTVLSVFTN